jgi:hypothetical protein
MVVVVCWLKGDLLSFGSAQVGHQHVGQENFHSTEKSQR